MSLIKCPECGHEVSTKAPNCPNCGVPILNNVKRCPTCNTIVLMGVLQCPQCETRFQMQTGSVMASTNERPEPPSTATTEAVTEEQKDSQAEAQPDNQKEEQQEPQSEESAPIPPKQKGGSPWWLLILAILAVAVGGFFYYERQLREASEEQDYTRLEKCIEQANFQDFLNRYPDSKYIDNVRARLKELQRIESEWNVVRDSHDRRRLKQFIEKNPTSVYKAAALHKIDSIDWRTADSCGTSAAYNQYIGNHENGDYISQAFSARAEADRREAQARRDSLAASAKDSIMNQPN